MRVWQMEQAGARFEALLHDSELSGPQVIASQGCHIAVVLSMAEYLRLTGADQSLVEFMRCSPLSEVDEFDICRDTSTTR